MKITLKILFLLYLLPDFAYASTSSSQSEDEMSRAMGSTSGSKRSSPSSDEGSEGGSPPVKRQKPQAFLSVLDAVHYFLMKDKLRIEAGQPGENINATKLQKLLYYAKGHISGLDRGTLFHADMEKNHYGPYNSRSPSKIWKEFCL